MAFSWVGFSVRAAAKVTSLACLLVLALPVPAASPDDVTRVLTHSSAWTAFVDVTSDATPTDRATQLKYRFFLRDGEVVGRTTGLAEGYNCEFKVRVREDEVDLHPQSRGCNGYSDNQPWTTFRYDPADATFPFKRLDVPQKWWLAPRP